MKHSIFIIIFCLHASQVANYGTMPDASQEGVLKQFGSYEDLALFHYTVPPETTRATWEFASFQDESYCPSREVIIYIQHGSFPVMSADNSSFPKSLFTERTNLHQIKTHSSYQPHDSTIFPVYNPLPGTWFVAAFLAPYEEKIVQQGLRHKCRYSLGSIALWSRADQVEEIIPFGKKIYTTKKHFSYYKFFIQNNVDSFTINISDCVHVGKSVTSSSQACIEYINLRARALPKHNPDEGTFMNVSTNRDSSLLISEDRPYKDKFYYLLVVSSAEVQFNLELNYTDCGQEGLYGSGQKNWYLAEEGLKYNATSGYLEPKEPKSGFQLFTVLNKLPERNEDLNYDLSVDDSKSQSSTPNSICRSTFEFSRIDNVEEFSTNFFLQGKSWYTKWITVTNRAPIMTRFKTLDLTDIGGTVNLVLGFDSFDAGDQTVEVFGCLSQDRQPRVENNSLVCEESHMLRLASDEPPYTAIKLIPFPEPSLWYLGLQVRCLDPDTRQAKQCWGNFRFANIMTSINLHIQPCGYRAQSNICGQFGVCVRTHKGPYMYTSCRCSSGYRGWTCDDMATAESAWKLIGDTLLLTLSNLFFLPAVILALVYRLYTEALIYGATMFFSTFYHTCDQEMSHLPTLMKQACHSLYVSREVLQFCDFFCAILSFWVTIISLAKLPDRLVNFLHMIGVLVIAVLVEYNRTGIFVLAIPIPLGLLIIIINLIVRSINRKKCLRPNRTCTLWVSLGVLCATTAVLIFALIETTDNYPYVHSGWHIMIALSLVFLLPYCKLSVTPSSSTLTSGLQKSDSVSTEDSELQEVDSLNWRDRNIQTISRYRSAPALQGRLSRSCEILSSRHVSGHRRTLIQTVPSLASQLSGSTRTIQTVPSLSRLSKGQDLSSDSSC